MLEAVVQMIEKTVLRGTPMVALVSSPSIPGRYKYNTAEAARHIGLRLPHNDTFHPTEIAAAHAKHGSGSCNNTSFGPGTCDDAHVNFSTRQIIFVEYTEAALLMHGGSMNQAAKFSWVVADWYMRSGQIPEDICSIAHLLLLYEEYAQMWNSGQKNLGDSD